MRVLLRPRLEPGNRDPLGGETGDAGGCTRRTRCRSEFFPGKLTPNWVFRGSVRTLLATSRALSPYRRFLRRRHICPYYIRVNPVAGSISAVSELLLVEPSAAASGASRLVITPCRPLHHAVYVSSLCYLSLLLLPYIAMPVY